MKKKIPQMTNEIYTEEELDFDNFVWGKCMGYFFLFLWFHFC